MPKKAPTRIVRRALRIEQNGTHPLYLFGLTGDEILTIADFSRVSRDDAGKLIGYQRPQVKRHIQDIVEYLDSGEIVFPNSIILALSSEARFKGSRGPQVGNTLVTTGTLELPIPKNNDAKPAWVVDGQQRVLALSKCKRRDLIVPVNAFVADQVELQRDQFLRINNTKPIPRGLLTELLPAVSSPLPRNLEVRKIPAAICDLLNTESESPFCGLIQRASSSPEVRKLAVIADASVVKMLQESLTSPTGCLFPYRNIAVNSTDMDGIWAVLMVYWRAVKHVFSDAWGKAPAKSRLMHGTGIRAMGRLMDKVMASINPRHEGALEMVEHELRLVAPGCHWTQGRWPDLDNLRWDEVQNVPKHIRLLSNSLMRTYVHARGFAT
jgi:DGQHR domain-containing protein